jgi:hypothetical protein
MARTTNHPKEENFNFRVPADLKAAFKAATGADDRPAAQVLRDFMRAYVRQRSKSEYDTWFRAQVAAAIEDPRPSIPHDAVIKRTRSVIDRIVAKNGGRED